MPLVIKRFRESLTVTVNDDYARLLDRRSAASEMYKVTETRGACLLVFRAPGAEAKDVIPDLLTLLRRSSTDDEYSGPKGSLSKAIIAQIGSNVDPLIQALKHKGRHVAYDVLTVMAEMSESAKALGPAVAAQIDNADDFVAEQAVRTLDRLGMEDSSSVERLRARISTVTEPGIRAYMSGCLAEWERMLRR